MRGVIFFLGGHEAKCFHTYRDCPRLNHPYRYHAIEMASVPPDGLRLCRSCEKRDYEAAYAAHRAR